MVEYGRDQRPKHIITSRRVGGYRGMSDILVQGRDSKFSPCSIISKLVIWVGVMSQIHGDTSQQLNIIGLNGRYSVVGAQNFYTGGLQGCRICTPNWHGYSIFIDGSFIRGSNTKVQNG